ncbi:hypothetical protein CRE_05262 [Caenorhabditis remanei]|uniref:Uncharacterized protein n=1 Tax=Caenorhabditis remanei TaxID=31234 RepID=E3NIF0_CAERE|nr:hypothetical protein CRE_05262 [Caenorhabditis remanei]
MQDENDKDVAEEKMGNEVDFLNCYDNIAESIFDETDEDSRRRLWRKLSEKDLRKLMFLLSTTQSKTAVNEYFDTEMLENQKIMKELLFRSEHLKEIEMCSTCAEDGEKCSCFNISSKCTVVFSDLSSLIRGMLQINGKHVLNVQSSIVRGECTTSPMGHGILKELLLNELTPGEVKVHFQCGFDGIKLHMKGRYKVWPFTLIPLDLEDKERATVRSVLTCAMYIGKTDPSANVHDRIINWCQNEMSYPISWNGLSSREKCCEKWTEKEATSGLVSLLSY